MNSWPKSSQSNISITEDSGISSSALSEEEVEELKAFAQENPLARSTRPLLYRMRRHRSAPTFISSTFAFQAPFSTEQLRARYGNHGGYVKAYAEVTKSSLKTASGTRDSAIPTSAKRPLLMFFFILGLKKSAHHQKGRGQCLARGLNISGNSLMSRGSADLGTGLAWDGGGTKKRERLKNVYKKFSNDSGFPPFFLKPCSSFSLRSLNNKTTWGPVAGGSITATNGFTHATVWMP